MRPSGGRSLYELVFWAAVIAIAYFNRGLYKQTEQMLEPTFQAYTQVVLVLIGLVLLITVNYLKEAIASTFIAIFSRVSGDAPLNYEKGNTSRNIQKTARRLERKGDFQSAGEAYESLELYRDAAAVYERGKLFSRAAGAWRMAGNTGKAIEYYEKDACFEDAGNLCLSEGLQDRATKNFRLAADNQLHDNQFMPAAELYEKAGDFNKAGSLYEQTHRMDRALASYERAGNTERLMALLREVPTADYHRRGPEFTRLILRCAEILASSGFTEEGAKIVEDCHDFVRAAELYSQCRHWDKAAELYLKAGREDYAAAVIERIENKSQKAELAAQLAISKSDWQTAAEEYEAAGKLNQAVDAFKKARNFADAGRIYEHMGRYIMAGEMYASGKDLVAAANAYAKAYDWRNAAECFEASGDLPQAVEAYANAANYLRAGILSIKLTDYPRAIEYLQRIPTGSPDFQMGTGFLATAFFYQNQHDMSYELFSRVMETLPLSKETLPVYYAYASNLERQNPKMSLALFRQILGVDLHYSDVTDKVHRLEQVVTSMSGYGHATPSAAGSNGGLTRQTPIGYTPPQTTQAQPTLRNTSVMQHNHTPHTNWVSHATPLGTSGLNQIEPAMFDGRYRLKDQLTNATGRIEDYQALDTATNASVVIRTFPRPEDPAVYKQTVANLESLKGLVHPGICPLLAYGESQGMIYTVTEMPSGSNLPAYIRSHGPMQVGDMQQFFFQILNALSFAHSKGFYHQNLRPSLIYIGDSGNRIIGFGVPSRHLNQENSVYLTVPDSDPQFLAPEQIIGGQVNEQTDIYSLGHILFYVLTGRTPFEVKRINDTQEIARMQVQVALPRPSSIRATLPTAIDEIFLRCVNKSPAARFPSAQELMKELNQVHTNSSIA